MRSTHWVVGLSFFGATCAISACGASSTQQQPTTFPTASSDPVESSSSEVHKRGGKKLIVEVGPRGGTLELGNGARIAIPQGALSETVEVTFAEGARTILALFVEQTSLTDPQDFPSKADGGEHEVRELHPQPSDDSAFQP